MNHPTQEVKPDSSMAAGSVLVDPRALAFRTPGGPEIFHAVAHRNEIWHPDPFDVETIHEEAREVFRSLVARASMSPRPTSGRILLLLGESGSGKTHLMRAFRNWTHGGQRGYCGYMQMTSATDQYGRYVLNNLIDSLSQPYHEPFGETSGLTRLSTALAESSRFVPADRLAQLREDELDARCLGRLIEALADQIVEDERFNDFDLDLVRALLYLQRDDPRLRGRVLKYLRCEELSPSDRQALGGLTPRIYPEAAERVVALLGRLMGSVESVPLILCLDQLEDIYNLDDAPVRFRRAMSTVCDLADRVPSAVVVISCLKDFYKSIQDLLATPARHRIEKDPEPIILSAKRELSEVVELIRKRLAALYEPHDIEIDESDPTYPIPREKLPELSSLPTRLILEWCREYRERCIARGTILVEGPKPPIEEVAARPSAEATIPLEQLWNDFRSGSSEPIPTDDVRLTRMLAWAIVACSGEVGGGLHFSADADGTMIAVERHAPDQSVDRMLVGVCNKASQGGGLGRQVEEVEKRTGDSTPIVTPVLVRSSGFPTNPKTEIAKQIGKLITRGGRRVVVEDSDWRAMQSMKSFRDQHQTDPAFSAWLVEEKPLSRLVSLRKILALDEWKAGTSTPTHDPNPPRPEPEPEAAPIKPQAIDEGAPLALGMTESIRPEPVTIKPGDLASHAAFLGATGSGKTTVALSIVEQLLIREIPAILVDRKGDLCRYADPAAWAATAPDAATEARRAAFRGRVEVAVFTPGSPEGRPLSIAAIPPGLGALKSDEREKTARYAASALGGMMGYKGSGTEPARTIILAKAMDLLSQVRPNGVTLPEIIGFIDASDPSLVNAIGKLDTKLFAKLVQDLETIRHSRGDLLSAVGEPMDAEALLGLGAHARPGKTRLSIISTKFLGPAPDVQFWVAQFLMEMARWTSRAPAKSLQAVLLFDEADLYLPAVGKPATKEPMEGLLKRARSAGLGLLLATQSPGDFDYRCRENIRSWFVGRVAQQTAIAKMRPMLSDCPVDVESRLPGQSTGQFHLIREREVTAFRADRSLMSTEQLPEGEILALARATRSAAS